MGALGGGDGEVVEVGDAAELCGPAEQVVGEDGAGEPGGVGGEEPGGAVVHAGAGFEVADGELDGGVSAVVLVGGDGVGGRTGDEGVVAPVGPEGLLGGVGEAAATHDEPVAALVAACAGDIGALGDGGLAGVGVDDGGPGVVVDGGDGGADRLVDRDGDRPADVQPAQGVDQLVGPEPRIGSQAQRCGGAGAADPGDEFFDEAFVASLRGPFTHAGMEHLAGLGAGGQ